MIWLPPAYDFRLNWTCHCTNSHNICLLMECKPSENTVSFYWKAWKLLTWDLNCIDPGCFENSRLGRSLITNFLVKDVILETRQKHAFLHPSPGNHFDRMSTSKFLSQVYNNNNVWAFHRVTHEVLLPSFAIYLFPTREQKICGNVHELMDSVLVNWIGAGSRKKSENLWFPQFLI